MVQVSNNIEPYSGNVKNFQNYKTLAANLVLEDSESFCLCDLNLSRNSAIFVRIERIERADIVHLEKEIQFERALFSRSTLDNLNLKMLAMGFVSVLDEAKKPLRYFDDKTSTILSTDHAN